METKTEFKNSYNIKALSNLFNISVSTVYRLVNNYEQAESEKKSDDLNDELLQLIKDIQRNHPFWGYRKMWAYLRYRKGYKTINEKRIYRIMKENNLLQSVKIYPIKHNNTELKPKPKPKQPNQWWGIDMTKFLVPDVGWIYVTAVKDWSSKDVIGYDIDLRCKTQNWLNALNMAVNFACPDGVRNHSIHLMSDNGCQPTSRYFMNECKTLGIKQAFTSYNNPKGNADTERFFRTLKEECIWINEWNNFDDTKSDVIKAINDYNNDNCMKVLDYKTPAEFRKCWLNNKVTFVA